MLKKTCKWCPGTAQVHLGMADGSGHTLKCKARSQVVSALLDWMEGLADEVTITLMVTSSEIFGTLFEK